MTLLLVIADGALTTLAGAAVAGLVSTQLRLGERCLIAMVAGLLLSSAMTYALALAAGLNDATVLGGPAVIAVVAALGGLVAVDPWAAWRESLSGVSRRWAQPAVWVGAGATAAVAALAAVLFAHTVYTNPGGLQAGYPTVWADWSQHLSTASSFAVGGNLPPQNPLLSGTPLLYPFLADFHAATLVTLGLDPGLALAIPGAVLLVVIGLLIVVLARRLGLSAGAGVIAALVCLLGGGLGFVGVFVDACTNHGYSASQCTLQYVMSHPGDGVAIAGWTLHDLPGTITAQPRAYDGLPSDGGPAPIVNQQWYTPLLAWWLPQRTILFGFAAAMCVLLLVHAASEVSRRGWAAFALAGVFLGMLPIVHVQTLLAMSIVLVVLAVRHRRREWLALLGVTVLLGGVRLAQLALAPHGSAAFANAYPGLEPGWLANAADANYPGGSLPFTPLNLVIASGRAAAQLFSPAWWGFWLANLGVAVPLCVVVLAASAARFAGGSIGVAARRILSPFPAPLLPLALASLLIFAATNVIVFQSWNWDNTKLLVYWYLAVGLLAGTLATHWWRGVWRRAAGIAMVGSMLLTGVLVALRLLPWTPAQDSINGPYTIADAQELRLASTVEAAAPRGAVFLTFGRPNDPLLAVAGRTGVLGYYGWMWSYGVDFGSRVTDVASMYRGCVPAQPCAVLSLLRRYGVSFVEIDDRVDDPGAITHTVGFAWWAGAGFPVVGRSDHITVYDVRGRD